MPDKAVPVYPAQVRIHHLYELLKVNVKPWEWDEDYDEDMIGFFYNEDIENIKAMKMIGL